MPDIYNMSDVFISYSRKDSDFVHKLFNDIKALDKEVWADFEDIPKAADWWMEIKAGIDAADTFLFVISPDSVRSDICRQEIEHAVKESNKRLIPILHREVIEEADKEKIHPTISSHNWIFFREEDNYEESFEILVESLETDLDHNRTLTRLLVRAREWDNNNRKKSYLLQGEDLDSAETWFANAVDKTPVPSHLHGEYIQASRAAQMDNQRRIMLYSVGGLIIAVILAIFAFYNMLEAREAEREAVIAREQAEEAREQALAAQELAEEAREEAEQAELEASSVALAASSAQALLNNNPDLSLVLAREAVSRGADLPQLQAALAAAVYAPGASDVLNIGDVIYTIVFSQGGERFVSGDGSGRICIYDDSGQLNQCLNSPDLDTAHDGRLYWLHMVEGGTRLLSSGSDDRLILWNIEETSPRFGSIVNETTITGLRASTLASDGSFALYGTDSGEIGFWNLGSGSTSVFYEHADRVNVLALNEDDNRLLAGGNDGTLLEFDLRDEPELVFDYFAPEFDQPISSVAFSPDGTIGMAGHYDAQLVAWDLQFAMLIRTYQGHDENITAITFADNGRSVFTSSWDNSIIEWDIATGIPIQTFHGHNGGINALTIDGDEDHMVSGGFDGTMRVWDVRPPIFEERLLTNDVSVYDADWNNRHIVAADGTGTVFIYDRDTRQLLHEVPSDNGEPVVDADIRDDGNNFAAVEEDCHTRLYDMRGVLLWEQDIDNTDIGDCVELAFRPGVDEIAVLSDTNIIFLNGRTGDIIRELAYFDSNRIPILLSFEFTPDGSQILLGQNDLRDNLNLIDAETGALIREFEGHNDGVLAIDFSDDGSRVVTGSFDNDVRVWDFATGESDRLFEGHSDRIVDVSFSPNEDYVISASNDRTMRLWDLATGFEAYAYEGHTSRIVSASFSFDGDQILTASFDSTLIIWNFPATVDEMLNSDRYIRALSCFEENVYLRADQYCE